MKKLLAFFLVLLQTNSFAQTNRNEELLNQQLGDFQLRYKELMNSRGFQWYQTKKINHKTIITALSEYDTFSPNPKTALLFYHHQNDSLYVWVISKKGIMGNALVHLTDNELKALEQKIKRSFAQSANRGAQVFEDDFSEGGSMDALSRAAEILFPLEVTIALNDIENLVIVPSLNIASLPLYSLKPFKESNDYLVDRMTITIAQSIDDLLNRIVYYCQVNQFGEEFELTFKPESPLVVGNPDFEACKTLFKQLPGAELEANNAAEKFGISILTGTEARKREVVNRMVKSELIYFATHGVADSNDPLNASYIVLAGEEGGDDCGKLTAKEIQELILKPDAIVVLSACQTGLGKTLDAGIIGIGRAFVKAGASNVFMSLWDVDDKTTQVLMGYFVEELFKPQQFFPATSLRKAILRYKQQNPNPSAWAAFISMGIPFPSVVSCQ